jgi:hypothetical protein
LSHSFSQLRQFLCPEKDKDDQQNNDQIWPCQIHKAREQAHNLYFNIRPPAEVAREFGGEGAGQLALRAAINPESFRGWPHKEAVRMTSWTRRFCIWLDVALSMRSSAKQPIVGPMNFFDDRALNRRVVVRAGQGNHLFFPGERINHQALKFRRNDLVVFGEEKNCAGMSSFCVGDAIEFAWNLEGDGSGQQPKIPPAVVAQDYLAQWWRIVENETADFAIGRHVHCHRAPDACAKNEDRLVSGFRLHRIEGGKCGGRHSFQTCWAGAAAEAGIIHSPDFNSAFAEGVGFERNPSFRAIGVAVETQNVSIDMIALLCKRGRRGPDFQFAILEWNDLPRCAVRVYALSCGKKDEAIG